MIAIHNSNTGFHRKWIDYCNEKKIAYKIVNIYSNDIIENLKDCYGLLWHHHQSNYKDILIAKQILFALEHTGFKVFPNFKTGWHFDDKIAQKYLLELIDAPLVKTYIFLDKKTALNWISSTNFPKVFKLRGGAGSANVKLVKNKKQAIQITNKAFKSGFSNYNSWESLNERIRKYLLGQVTIIEPIKGVFRLFKSPYYSKVKGNELGYVYFQDFVPNLNCDYRIIVIASKCFAIKRYTRNNDFRASGSGKLNYDKSNFPLKMLNIAFDISKRLELQSVAFDFIIKNENIMLIEVSYAFPTLNFADECPGYWDEDLRWYEGKFNPYGWIVDSILKND